MVSSRLFKKCTISSSHVFILYGNQLSWISTSLGLSCFETNRDNFWIGVYEIILYMLAQEFEQ